MKWTTARIIINHDPTRIDTIFNKFKANNFDVTEDEALVNILSQPDGLLNLSQSQFD